MSRTQIMVEVPHERSPLLRDYKPNSWSKGPIVTETSIPSPRSESIHNEDSRFLSDLTTFKFWLIFTPILVQYFVAMFDSFLMVSSHPVITSYFNASNSASWLSTAFMLTSAALQPVFGRMSDMFGRRPVYMSALLIFAWGTAYCAGAHSIGDFIAGRAICGVGAGAMISMGNIIVNDLVKIQFRGTYQAYINLLYGGGAAAGAAFGGYLCERIGWRGTFAIQVPVILVVYAMAWFTVPKNLGPQLANDRDLAQLLKEFDLSGSFLLFTCVAFLILGLNLGGNVYSWNHPVVVSSLLIAVVTGIILIWVEGRAERPIMPLEMIFKAPRSNLVFSNFFAMIGCNTILFNAPIYFEVIHGDSPAMAGLRISSPALFTTLCGLLTGFFLTYTGRMKEPQVLGAVCMLVGGLATAMLCESTPQWLATLSITPPYAGQGFLFPATILGLLASSSQAEQATMMTTLILWRNLGIVFGVAISSLVLQNALIRYLEMYVTGHYKREIIEMVRMSVRAVRDLKGEHKRQAIAAYSAALKLTFVSGLIFFVIVFVLVATVKLPRLASQKTIEEEEDEV